MKTIKGRILLSIDLIVAVSLLLVGVTSVTLNYKSTYGTLEQTMVETAQIAADRVSHELKEYMNVAYETGSIARLANPELPVETKKSIIDQRAGTYGFQRGNLVGPDGVSLFDGNNYSDRAYFQTALTGVPCVSEPLVSKVTGKLSVMVAAPLWEGGIPNTEVVGVIYYVPPETFLNDIVSSIQVSPSGTARILNGQGAVIAHPEMEQVKDGTNVTEQAKSDPSFRALAALEAEMVQGKAGFGFYNMGGARRFLAYAPIANTDGWSIGISAPMQEFMGDTLTGIYITVALLVVALLAAGTIGAGLAARISRPVKQCAQRLALVAQGDLSSPVPQSSARDETGGLLRDLKATVDRLKDVIADASFHMGAIAQGDLSNRVTRHYKGDFQGIERALKETISSLGGTIGHINQAAAQVSGGAGQVAGGAQALSQGATEQASAVQELAATVTEISGHVKDNATNAASASSIAGEAGQGIAHTNQQMGQLVQAMQEISNASAGIGKIIKTIEDIAFQTNILALNAAVEAARAGAAGKGFAVVADEVRNLANKSQEAAKETTALIESSLEAVEHGTQIAGETAQSLGAIVSLAQRVVDTVDKISKASGEQAGSIAQVTQGIEQISNVVQQNSATAEQSAAASEQLSSQANTLKDLMGKFKLAGGEAAPGPDAAGFGGGGASIPEQESGKYTEV